MTTFSSSILAAFLIGQMPRRFQWALFFLAAVFLFSQARTYARPEYFVNRPLEFYTTNEDSTTVAAEYTPKWVKTLPSQRSEKKVAIIKGEGEIGPLTINSKRLSFQAKLKQASSLRINIHYFPGWQLFINGQKKAIAFEENGLIEFNLPAGESEVSLIFGETAFRYFSDLISLFSLIMILVVFFKKL